MVRRMWIALLLMGAVPASAQVDARMFRQPAVSADKIAFVYAGDIWLVPKSGGAATRLSSPPGEESFPRFSPDGSKLAYSADYDGNTDVYVVPTAGGEPVRLTHHPMGDRVVGWHPDGKRVLFASSRESGRQRYSQFYLVGLDGGLPEKLPVPYGEFGTFSPDGASFVYMPMSQDFRNWKRYRGGWAPDLWLFDLKTFAARNITNNPANDAQPMWFRNTVYFISDRGAEQRNNIWAEDVATGAVRQVTRYDDFDITFPSIGPDAIVFQKGGRIYLLSLPGEKVTEVPIRVVTDATTLRARTTKADKEINAASVSPTGRRVVFEARGDVVTLPAERGAVINVTRSSGVADRYPRWSPDGKTLAYWSDRSGEYELTFKPADGTGAERKVTSLGRGFRYAPQWSPDSKKLAFIDQAMRIRIYDDAAGKVVDVDKSPDLIAHDGLEAFRFQWSADSRWLAYARPAGTGNNAIFLFDTHAGQLRQATSGYLNETQPTFDPEGKYLFYASDRAFDPVYGTFDNTWTYANPTRLIAVPLRKDVKSPLAARNDAENSPEAARRRTRRRPTTSRPRTTPPPADVAIDFDRFEQRSVVLPPKSGNYADLQAVKGKLLYRRSPRAGTHDEKSPVVYYDLEEREEKTILDDADGFEATFDGKKIFVVSKKKFAIVEVKEKQKFEKPIALDDIEVPVDPRAEWRQLFMDTYRFERDFFYDPGMHGVNWDAMKARYMTLLDDAVTRWDVNWIIGEFLGELNASHTYHGGGDLETAPTRSIGMLGVDWELAERRLPHQADRARRPMGHRRRLAARRARRRREGRRLRPRRQRPAARHEGRSVGQLRGPRQEDRGAHGQRLAVGRERAPGGRHVPGRRDRAQVPCVDRGAAAARRQGDQRQGRLHLRPEHRHRRAERADAAVHGAVEERGARHRRAVEQRRPDSGSLHRAAEPADPVVLGRARRAGAAVAAGVASRSASHADQRMERIGRRRVPVLFPRGGTGAADRHPHVGRAHRHQRRAVARRRRRDHRADLPDVRPEGHLVRRRPRRRSRHSGRGQSVAAREGDRSAAAARDRGNQQADRLGAETAGAAGVREANALITIRRPACFHPAGRRGAACRPAA